MAVALETYERTRLSDLEGVIERGLSTFVEVGEALLEIRSGRLYRESHHSFEAYCRERWGFSRDRGDQLIQAAEVVRKLPTMVGNGLNERVARELVPVMRREPAALPEVMAEAEARSDGPVTAVVVREVVMERLEELPYEKGRQAEARSRPERVLPWRRYFTQFCNRPLREDKALLLQMDAQIHKALRLIGAEED